MDNIQILIVEDDPIIGTDLEDRLTEMGYQVIGLFESGEEAYQKVKDSSPDLIIMDVQLSGQWDGIETVQQIFTLIEVPVIFLTSNTDESTFSKAKNTFPAAFLAKPYRGRDLKYAIELALKQFSDVNTSCPFSQNQAPSKPNSLNDRIFVKVKDRMEPLFYEDILWVEADDYYCKVYTKTQEIQISQTLGKFSEALANFPEFLRVHRSYIINLKQVDQIGDAHLYIGKQSIPVSKSIKEEIMSRLRKIS